MAGAFFPASETLAFDGVAVAVAPIRVRHVAQAYELALPMLGLLDGDSFNPLLLLPHVDRMAELLALVCGFEGLDGTDPADWLGNRDLADLALIVSALLRVNGDFLHGKLVPILQSSFPKTAAAAD